MRPFTKRSTKDAPAEKAGKKTNSRGKSRKLQNANHEDSMSGAYNATAHKIRHKKKQRKSNDHSSDKRRLNETDFMHRNDPYRATAVNMTKSIHEVGLPGNHSLALINLDTRFINHTEDIIKERIGTHSTCYTPGEVLEIIAMTCLVNFIFWFSIITCVSFVSKKERAKYTKWESLESIEIISEDEIRMHDSNHYPCCLRRSLSPSEYADDGFGNDFVIPEEDDPLVRRIDGRYSFSRNSCFEDDSQDWGILYTDNSENNYWRDRPRSPDDAYSEDNLLLI